MFGRVSCFAKHCRQAFDWPYRHFKQEKCTRMGKCRFYMAIGNATFLCLSQTETEFISSSTVGNYSDCREEEFGINNNLETALQEGREVLFASWYGSNHYTVAPTSSFLAVPQKYDTKLKRLLESINYGLNN